MNKILITGATGFIGGAVLANLAARGEMHRALLLVRGETVKAALERIRQRLRGFGLPESQLHELAADQILLGDLVDPSRWENDGRLGGVSYVIHSAAMASFGRHDGIWAANVDGTKALAAIVRARCPLERFVYVGTAMVCGARAPSPVGEDYAADGEPEDLVEYTASKRAAEAALRTEFGDMPVVIARTSIVVGHSRLGCAPSGSIFWVFRTALALGAFPCSFDDRIDVVPVDFVAESLLQLAQKPGLAHDVYHLSAGASACSFREIDAAIAAAMGREPLADYRQMPYEEMVGMQRSFERFLGQCNRRVMLRAIRTYGAFSALDLVFDNSRLLAEGVARPMPFAAYAGVCAVTSIGQTIAEQMQADFK